MDAGDDLVAAGPGDLRLEPRLEQTEQRGLQREADVTARHDGRLPINPSGGILGRGHPVGASGLAGIASVVEQIDGSAGPLAIARRPTIGLAQSIGGLGSHNFVTILGRHEGP